MASKSAIRRLNKEYKAIAQSPPPYICAKPLENNILEWHYVLRGPQETPYEGGEYHGVLKFPGEYPFKPPAIQMITPSGRFQTNTNICTTMSNFHPNLWNPTWSVATILNGLLSFMVEDETTTGGIRMTDRDRRILAGKSHNFNLDNSKFKEIFPELCTPQAAPLPDNVPKPQVPASTTSVPNLPAPQNIGAKVQFFTPHAQLRNRPLVTKVAPATGTEEPEAAVVPSPRRSRWFSFEPYYKLYVILVIFLYLIAAKLISRAASTPV
ncbi:Ubiquitin-conjugating enzyme E2 6 [Tieghemiomyces parasiticus]|uniref:Ubiquitin-conjugating enzyme E2 6 n=1 Tax=Tieghemiomyces parasiticus TaxID=78921 RepID=A0A9W8E308_9FUNG|nr:Ubiquitin-conjugating enzyme E2 6 [Tieghemiomyces parasiticus]